MSDKAATTALRNAAREVTTLKRLAPGVDTTPIATLLGTHLGWRRPTGMTEGQRQGLGWLCEMLDLHLPATSDQAAFAVGSSGGMRTGILVLDGDFRQTKRGLSGIVTKVGWK